MNDIVTLIATVTPNKVVINNPITVTVQGINRYGQTVNLSTADYSIDSTGTNTAGSLQEPLLILVKTVIVQLQLQHLTIK